MICSNCYHYERVDGGSEVGVLHEKCSAFERGFRHPIKTCTNYSARNSPMLFANEAWKPYKNKDGDYRFFPPDTPYAEIKAWTKDDDEACIPEVC